MDKKTSVKVHNPPGGASNFSLGGGYENEAPKKPAGQNKNNQESVEDNDPSKTSVKVHQQPGGNSNFSLGGYDQPANTAVKTSVKVHQQSHNNIFGGYEEEKPQPKRAVNQHNAHTNIFGGYEEPPKKPVQQQQQQQQQQGQQTQQQDTAKTSVKVHNPPGGRSNFTLG